jgi:DNA-binding CsgD family transcriptional regulator
MLEELDVPARLRRGEDQLEIVAGHQAIGARVRQVLDTAADELLVLGNPAFGGAAGATGVGGGWSDPLSRGVRTRRIDAAEAIARQASAAEQVRICAQPPTEFVIADRAVALLPVADEGTVVADSVLVVRSSVLLAALVRLFELLWQSSVPVSRREAEPPADERLLLLLAAGLKDEAIARRLGISLRTVHRRTSELLDRLGARTRFQAGAEAVRSGMLLREGNERWATTGRRIDAFRDHG